MFGSIWSDRSVFYLTNVSIVGTFYILQALQLTEKVIGMNPANYSVWYVKTVVLNLVRA